MSPQRTLSVVVAPDPEPGEGDAKGLFRRPDLKSGIVKEIPVEQLQKEFDSLSEDIAAILDAAPATDPDRLRLKELAVQVEITASGGINLIGNASVGATASMTLTFSRD
jgi:hypothetical protein